MGRIEQYYHHTFAKICKGRNEKVKDGVGCISWMPKKLRTCKKKGKEGNQACT
jgi:hypothetical protein